MSLKAGCLRPRRRTAGRIGLVAIALVATLTMAPAAGPASAAPAEPAGAYEDDLWEVGSVGFTLYGTFTHMMSRLSYQGPPTSPLRQPRVGEVFYVRMDISMVFDGAADSMVYQPELLLPDTLQPAVSDAFPFYCSVVVIADPIEPSREYPGCGATRSGLFLVFTPVEIRTDEGVMIWLPVRATAPLNAEVVQFLARRTAGDVNPVVNPMLSQLAVTVGAGVPSSPRSVAVAAATRSVNVSWAAPASNGGSRITGYTARAWTKRSGGVKVGQCSTTGTRRCTINRLRSGTRVFVDVVARNGIGTSRPGSPRVGRTPL